MSYDYSLLYHDLLARVRLAPSAPLRRLALEMGVTRRTLQAVVSRCAGGSFGRLRRTELRPVVAALMLERPGLSIKEISSLLGFRTPRAFTRALTRACGQTPPTCGELSSASDALRPAGPRSTNALRHGRRARSPKARCRRFRLSPKLHSFAPVWSLLDIDSAPVVGSSSIRLG